MAPIFHLAFPTRDLEQTKAFYVEGLGCQLGRESPSSAILNLQGHQLVAHLTQKDEPVQSGIYPRHFGLVFETEVEWETLLARAQEQELTFYQQPRRRFQGSVLEHRTFFLADPFGNLMEFKYYCNPEAIFGAREEVRIGDAG